MPILKTYSVYICDTKETPFRKQKPSAQCN